MLSYAAAVSATKKEVKFVYSEELPSTSDVITETRQVSLVVKKGFDTTAQANNQFRLRNGECLEGLNTSADLIDYVVNSADGNTVQFRHKDDVKTVIAFIYIPIHTRSDST
jgi:hypothetical protein